MVASHYLLLIRSHCIHQFIKINFYSRQNAKNFSDGIEFENEN